MTIRKKCPSNFCNIHIYITIEAFLWLKKKLLPWHVVVFWLGFVCDTIGTGAMGKMAGSIIQFNFHGLTGLAAILLMLFHAIWATIVIVKKKEKQILTFHKFSIVVWVIWLIPMITGMILGSDV